MTLNKPDKKNEVKAVTDMSKIPKIEILLEQTYSKQFSDIWKFGLQVALRISDLLKIKMTDVDNGVLYIKEGKTGKHAEIPLNSVAMEIFTRNTDGRVYLFQSLRSRSVSKTEPKPLDRSVVARAFKEVGNMESIKVKLGTHSMRKTRGYHMYKKTNDIARVMKMLRHTSVAATLSYIGITQEEINSDYMEYTL